jgi:hypothetical protein
MTSMTTLVKEELEVVKDFNGGQSVNTPLSPNSNCVTVPSGDTNDDTNLTFLYNNIIPYWSPAISSANTKAVLGTDMGNGVVTFKAGLTVQYAPQSGGVYTVLLTGDILDGTTLYPITGKSLGTFPQNSIKK